MHVSDLDTPAVVVELDALEDNLDRYQRYFDEHGIGLRPHIKTHKTLAVAHLQMGKGAVGLSCQKVGEAEVMAAGGLTQDLLIPYCIVGPQKLDRLTALVRQARVTVAADSEYVARGLSEAAAREGVTIGVIIEVDTGGGRTGIPPRQTLELGQTIDRLPGLELRGIMGFPTPPDSRPVIQETLALFDRGGLPHPIVSGGSTKCALQAHEIPELTEYRAGEYPLGGEGHFREGRHTIEQCALRVIMTVISRPTAGRAILDGGSKTLSASTIQTERGTSMGYLVEYPEAHFYSCSEEHGMVDVSACARQPEVGERVQVIPVHPCPCVNEHDELVAVRRDRVEARWPVLARGKVR